MAADDEPSASKTLAGITLTDVRVHRGPGERRGSLLVIAGAHADLGAHLLVDGEVVIGRELGDLRLHDGRVSRRHVRVWDDGGRYYVEDLRSTNGSMLNGRVIERVAPLGDGDKVYVGNTVLKFTLVDDTEAAYHHRMERLAGSDPLTGLHAKHRFDSLLEEAIRSATLSGEPLWLLMMDMDGLKAINDRHGHPVGAHTIGEVGARIGRILGERGEACRFGGDEYCAFVARSSEPEVVALAEAIRAEVEQATFTHEAVQVRATISVGGAAVGPSTRTVAALLAAADRNLYRAKALGRNRVVVGGVDRG